MDDLSKLSAEELMDKCLLEYSNDVVNWKSAALLECLRRLRAYRAMKAKAEEIRELRWKYSGWHWTDSAYQEAACAILAAAHRQQRARKNEQFS